MFLYYSIKPLTSKAILLASNDYTIFGTIALFCFLRFVSSLTLIGDLIVILFRLPSIDVVNSRSLKGEYLGSINKPLGVSQIVANLSFLSILFISFKYLTNTVKLGKVSYKTEQSSST